MTNHKLEIKILKNQEITFILQKLIFLKSEINPDAQK